MTELSPSSPLGQRCGNVRDGSEENERIVFRGHKTPPAPELRGFVIDGVDHQGTPADQPCRMDAALERMFHQTCADALPYPSGVRCKLTEKQAGNGIGRLAGADRARQDRWQSGGGREAIISNDPPCLMHHENGRKAFLLVRQGAGFQPMVERRLATGELRDVVRGRDRFGSR